MPIVPVKDVSKYGIIKDLPPSELPFEAWSEGINVRATLAGIACAKGEYSVFGLPANTPFWAMPITVGGVPTFILGGANKLYQPNASTGTNRTRQTAGVDVNYAATVDLRWDGTNLAGVPILTNGVDVPQMWQHGLGDTRFKDLTNWPSIARAKYITSFKSHLIAANIQKSGIEYPMLVKWSHPADPGAVPVSWDEADPTKDAGEWPLAETPGQITGLQVLGETVFIFKTDATHMMRYIGGTYIFSFSLLSRFYGMPSPHAVAEVPTGKLLVWVGDDIVLMDNQSINSILDQRARSMLSYIDSTNMASVFVVTNPLESEIWFCWSLNPSSPYAATIAMVWNWKTQAITYRDLSQTSFIAVGPIDLASISDTNDAAVGTNDSDTVTNDSTVSSIVRRNLLGLNAGQPVFLDTGTQMNGGPINASIERQFLGIPFKANTPPDTSSMKFLRAVYPRITGTAGQTVMVTVGSHQRIDDPVTWEDPIPFVIGQDNRVDVTVSGRLFAIKFSSSSSSMSWLLTGYDLDVEQGGE